MTISKDAVVSVSYELWVNSELTDKAESSNPMQFIFGHGTLIQAFEDNLKDLKAGDTFDFQIEAENGYGLRNPEYLLKLPISIFERDGELAEDLLVPGNRLPMMDQEGNRMDGVVLEVKDDVVIMDFNHPLAGEDLHFKGKIESIRNATPDEISHGHVHTAGHSHGDGHCEGCNGDC